MRYFLAGIIALLVGPAAQAGEFGIINLTSRGWTAVFSELLRSVDIGTFVVLVIFVVTIGLAIDAFYHIRFAKMLPEELLAAVQDEMANGEYERALEACLKSDSVAGNIFAAALSKTDHSFERMEDAMHGETEIMGLIWRQWVAQFKLLALISAMGGILAALVNLIRLVADIPGRPNLGLVFASSFEMRAYLYCIFGSLFLGALSATFALVIHFFCRSRLERIILEANRLGEELLDPFRPLPLAMGEE